MNEQTREDLWEKIKHYEAVLESIKLEASKFQSSPIYDLVQPLRTIYYIVTRELKNK